MKRLLQITLTLASGLIGFASGQEMTLDVSGGASLGSGYFDKWDPLQDKLILYHDLKSPENPAVRIFAFNGVSIDVFSLRDLPDAQQMTVWDAAAAPDGGVVVSAIAEYGPRDKKPVPIKRLILTYDAAGHLRSVWDTAPYHHRLVAVDGRGDVFGFGAEDSYDNGSPLLVKYSQDGNVLGEFLPAYTLASGDKAVHRLVSSSSQSGESSMFVSKDELLLWLAPSREFLRFSLEGKLLERLEAGPPIRRLSESLKVEHIEVSRAAMEQGGDLLCQIKLWPSGKRQKVKFAMMSVSRDGSIARLLSASSDRPTPGPLVGVTSAGRMVYLEDMHGAFGTYRIH